MSGPQAGVRWCLRSQQADGALGLGQDDGVIISHQHRFIFIKTQKTAGTSVEVLLSDIIEDAAVVTPVQPPVEGHRPRNFTSTGRISVDASATLRSGARRLRSLVTRTPFRPDLAFYNHMPATRVIEQVGRRTWDSYLTFTFERNPWDKVASAFFWQRGGEADPEDFRAWVASRAPASTRIYSVAGTLPVDFPRYSLDGRTIGVDLVGRFEHLADDLQSVLDQVGLAGAELPRSKSGTRPTIPLRDLYDDETAERVAVAFSKEIDTFGYSFPE